jgi:hypothetical protein
MCLINQVLRHEDIWESGGIDPPFSTSALDGGEWSESRPGRFNPGKTARGAHRVGGWVDSKVGLNSKD